ncbi:hypothetical protein FOCC_FOCC002660 [Frankliniella occidentalis]|nr:hypothetical protein FOCC_FOCC002660 [Frankliniella occidentalis]
MPEQLLPNLEVLDLSHNDLCCLWGLRRLPRLAVLDLGHNQVRCLRPPAASDASPRPRRGAAGPEEHVAFPTLHTLFLDHNGLSCLAPLELGSLRRLRTLFLQHNQLDSLSGLGIFELRGLVLDGNHLEEATVQQAAEAGLLREVRDLHLDGNHLQGLGFLGGAKGVVKLFVAKNKIADPGELEGLRLTQRLAELCLLGNPVCLRPRHFALMRELLPDLQLLDGHPMDLCNSCPTPMHIPLGWGPAGDRPAAEKEARKDIFCDG